MGPGNWPREIVAYDKENDRIFVIQVQSEYTLNAAATPGGFDSNTGKDQPAE